MVHIATWGSFLPLNSFDDQRENIFSINIYWNCHKILFENWLEILDRTASWTFSLPTPPLPLLFVCCLIDMIVYSIIFGARWDHCERRVSKYCGLYVWMRFIAVEILCLRCHNGVFIRLCNWYSCSRTVDIPHACPINRLTWLRAGRWTGNTLHIWGVPLFDSSVHRSTTVYMITLEH